MCSMFSTLNLKKTGKQWWIIFFQNRFNLDVVQDKTTNKSLLGTGVLLDSYEQFINLIYDVHLLPHSPQWCQQEIKCFIQYQMLKTFELELVVITSLTKMLVAKVDWWNVMCLNLLSKVLSTKNWYTKIFWTLPVLDNKICV